MAKKKTDILSEVAGYYSSRLAEYGDTPRGVDWNGEESQVVRFKQLSKIVDGDNCFSINDIGCGYGALYDYLSSNYKSFSYCGVDIAPEMIAAAKHRYNNRTDADFVVSSNPPQIADYCVASGIFNVRLDRSDNEWKIYFQELLDTLDRSSYRGFAFNCLTSYSDPEKMKDYLYYADPCFLFDLCKRRYSRHVSLLHDYGLYEFTVLVRKVL